MSPTTLTQLLSVQLMPYHSKYEHLYLKLSEDGFIMKGENTREGGCLHMLKMI